MEQSGILLWKQAYASHHTHFCDQDEQCGGAQCGAIAATIATAEVGTVEKQPKMEGRSMTMFLAEKR